MTNNITSSIRLNAEDVWNKLDAKDNVKDVVTHSVWDQFRTETGVQANSIKWQIEKENGIKSICHYLNIHANNTDILTKIAKFCGIEIQQDTNHAQQDTAGIKNGETPKRTLTKENMYTSFQFAGIDVEKLNMEATYEHYDELLKNKPDIGDSELTEHMINYAKGMIKHDEQELKFAEQYQIDLHKQGESGVFDATEYTDEELELLRNNTGENLSFVDEKVREGAKEYDVAKVAQAFHQNAREYIATYDTNGDNEIDIDEFVAMEERELGRKLTEEEKSRVKLYAEKQIIALECYKTNEHSNNKLDENEITAYLYARAYSKKDSSETTYEEFRYAQDAIKFMTTPLDQLTETQKAQRKEFISLLKGGDTNLNKPSLSL